jgi:hypothetical protein
MIANVVESRLVELAGQTPAPPTNLPLPPSERDFEVYGLVVVEGVSTRAVARAVGLSQTRVIQIRNRVAEWMASEVPPLSQATPVQKLALAAQIARDRFDFLYSQAMDAWRESKGTQSLTRFSSGGETTSTRESYGDPRHLMLAARIAERALGVEVKIEKGNSVALKLTKAAAGEPADHPVGDCSPQPAAQEEAQEDQRQAAAVSASERELSDEVHERRRGFLNELQGAFETCSPSPREVVREPAAAG